MSHSQVPQGRGGFPGMQWSQAGGLGGLSASPEFFCSQSTWEGTGREAAAIQQPSLFPTTPNMESDSGKGRAS